MILPPFFGIAVPQKEDFVKRVVIDYLNLDTLTFFNPTDSVNITYHNLDVLTIPVFEEDISITYHNLDCLTWLKPIEKINLTFNCVDVLYWKPPPELPLTPEFLSYEIEDSQLRLAWSAPYDNRCNITEYILEYNDCFLSNILAEDSNKIVSENIEYFIQEFYKTGCYWQQYDFSKILIEDNFKLQNYDSTFILTESSSGIGTLTTLNVENLINNQSYIFRVAAVNCIGTGNFGYSDVLIPIGPKPHNDCDVILFMHPDSTNDLQQSLVDYSCYINQVDSLEGVFVSTDSAFGLGSLYFDGLYGPLPEPGTYSHLRIENINDNYWSLVGDFTIEMWIKPDNSYASSTQTLISSYTQNEYYYGDNNNYWKLYRYQNTIRFIAQIDEYINVDPYFIYGYIQLVSNNFTLSTTDFTHIAVSRFNDKIKLYINGQLHDTEFFDQNINIISNTLVVGADQTPTYDSSDIFGIDRGAVYQPYFGHIDDIMVSKSARYTRNFQPVQYKENLDCSRC